MNNINFKPYTVVLACGPSGVGKSYTIKTLMKYIDDFNYTESIEGVENKVTKLSTIYLSSDQFRYDLLKGDNKDVSKFNPVMGHVSSQAFHLLQAALTAHMSYPVNTHLIFIDTTSLTKEWRMTIIDLCQKFNYNIDLLLFDFENRKDYFTYSQNRRVTEEGVKRLYEQVIPDLERHQYNNIIKFKNRNLLDNVNEYNIINMEQYKELNKVNIHNTGSKTKYYIVGDVHGNYHTLKTLIEQVFECSINDEDKKINIDLEKQINNKIVLAGDLIDKGSSSKEVLELVCNNPDNFIVVIGNHENFVYKYLENKDNLKDVPQFVVDTYFTTIKQYEDDPTFYKLLEQVVNQSLPFFQTPFFIVTHAPCQNKHLGKLNNKSLRAQRNWIHPTTNGILVNTKEVWEQELAFLKEEANWAHPLHLFGHICLEQPLKFKNKISLDSGAVVGNGLTYYELEYKEEAHYLKTKKHVIATDSRDLISLTNESIEHFKPNLYTLFNTKIVNHKTLEGRELSRVTWACKNKVNYISSTMAPAKQSLQLNEEPDIESLEQGLLYYKDKGINSIMLQPKHMGSRCNVYLMPKISDCYMTSRNGYVIKKLYKEKGSIDNFRSFFKKLKDSESVRALYEEHKNLQAIILDGELLPWFALGKNLIENTYDPLHTVIQTELTALQKENFPLHLQQTLNNIDDTANLNHRLKETNNILKSLMKDQSYSWHKEGYINTLKEACQKYQHQINLFGRTGNIEFKPFSILKLIMNDGSEILPNYTTSYVTICNKDETYLTLDFKEDFAIIKDKATRFFNEIANKNLEGVVIKPILQNVDSIETKQLAPYLKVRNKEYLRLVYGYDYIENQTKYNHLTQSKNTHKKIQVSINEFLIGQKILQIPYNQINLENETYKNLIASMIVEEKVEQTLDPRL